MRATAVATCATVIVAAIAARPAASPSDGERPWVTSFAQVPEKPRPFAARVLPPPIQRATTGALAGKTVYLSAGHGWFYSANAWRTQRGNTHDLVEDFITIEGVSEYLIAYLHAMGAYVVPIRESDQNPNSVIVDDGDVRIEGTVSEVATTDAGWGTFPIPFDNVALQPFALGSSRLMAATASETGRAVFDAAIPESGYYNVYVAYVQGSDRVSDAHVIVRHAGGESHVRIDQRRHGGTWVLLGRWYFEAGGMAAVALANDSAGGGGMISLDAVRFGGGMAVQSRAGATTGRPAFETAAVYSTQLLGAPASVYNALDVESSNDVISRPRFAAWEHEAGEDAIYLAYHTNAPDPQRGTMSIAFGNTYPCCQPLSDFAGTTGSLELLHAVHDELIADIRASYDPTWRNAGKVTAALGELNTSHNNEMPAILVELAFHSTAADADALRDPAFRRLSARAMAQGIAKYFAARDGATAVLPPESPTAIRVEAAGASSLRVSWRPPATTDAAAGDAATSYRVYLSENGYGFDDGVAVAGETITIDQLPMAALRFVRVTAVNAGGESMPTEVVGARLPARGGVPPVLVVGGFDRLDAFQMIRDEAPLVGIVDRMRLERMNDGTYAARHGQALADAGYAFDGATDEAVAARDVDLAAYKAIDWFTGEQANAGALPAATREELARFFVGGGALIVNGSELVWALDAHDVAEDQMFVHEALHVSLAADDAESYDVTPLPGPFAALAPMTFRDTAAGGYDAEMPDALVPGADAMAVLAYGSTSAAAAVAWEGGIVFGFPIELVQGADARSKLLDAALTHFGIEKDPDLVVDTGCGCHSTGTGGSVFVLVFVMMLRLRRRR